MTHAHENQAIIAQCTPSGSGALALLRISGTDAITLTAYFSRLASGIPMAQVPTHTIAYGTIHDTHHNPIDHVLFLVMYGPKTFTGQDTVEITCHNNPFIIEAIISRAIEHGARLAGNGEFTRRAVLNNKIDLLQAEAIHELIQANTQQVLKKSLAQLDGSFSHQIDIIEKNLVTTIALAQASFEFLDEEQLEFGPDILKNVEAVCISIQKLKKNFNQQQQIRQGIRIAIIGSVNAGKSSLFNALIGTARAIVSPIAGTTRDVIEAGLYKNGNYWTLVDTAGLRHAQDTIEQEGIRRSFEQAHLADVIILICDTSRVMNTQEQEVYQRLFDQYRHKIVIVTNKADLPQQPNSLISASSIHSVCTTDKNSINTLESAIQ